MTLSALPLWDRVCTHFSLPVLMKEMRVRMRGLRAPILLGITTALAIIVGLCIIIPGWDTGINNSDNMAQVGESLFRASSCLKPFYAD